MRSRYVAAFFIGLSLIGWDVALPSDYDGNARMLSGSTCAANIGGYNVATCVV